MCHFGGPRGLFTTDTTGPLVLHYYGSGDRIGDVLPARSGVAQGTPEPDHVYATGLALPGDGGSPVITNDGLALGILVTSSPHGVGLTLDRRATAGPLPREPPGHDRDDPARPSAGPGGGDVGRAAGTGHRGVALWGRRDTSKKIFGRPHAVCDHPECWVHPAGPRDCPQATSTCSISTDVLVVDKPTRHTQGYPTSFPQGLEHEEKRAKFRYRTRVSGRSRPPEESR